MQVTATDPLKHTHAPLLSPSSSKLPEKIWSEALSKVLKKRCFLDTPTYHCAHRTKTPLSGSSYNIPRAMTGSCMTLGHDMLPNTTQAFPWLTQGDSTTLTRSSQQVDCLLSSQHKAEGTLLQHYSDGELDHPLKMSAVPHGCLHSSMAAAKEKWGFQALLREGVVLENQRISLHKTLLPCCPSCFSEDMPQLKNTIPLHYEGGPLHSHSRAHHLTSKLLSFAQPIASPRSAP